MFGFNVVEMFCFIFGIYMCVVMYLFGEFVAGTIMLLFIAVMTIYTICKNKIDDTDSK